MVGTIVAGLRVRDPVVSKVEAFCREGLLTLDVGIRSPGSLHTPPQNLMLEDTPSKTP